MEMQVPKDLQFHYEIGSKAWIYFTSVPYSGLKYYMRIPHAHVQYVELEGTCRGRGRKRSESIDELRVRRGYGRAGRGAIMHDDDEDLLD